MQRIRLDAGIKVVAPRNRWIHDTRSLSATKLAARLNIPVNWLVCCRSDKKRLQMDRQPTGAYLFPDTEPVLHAIQNLRNHTISHLDLGQGGASTWMIEHVPELSGGDGDGAIRWRGPDEPAAFKAFGVKRHTQAVMPEDLQQVAAFAAENVKIAGVRIAPQRLLNPFMPRRISVAPAANQTCTPVGGVIIHAAPPSPGATLPG